MRYLKKLCSKISSITTELPAKVSNIEDIIVILNFIVKTKVIEWNIVFENFATLSSLKTAKFERSSHPFDLLLEIPTRSLFSFQIEIRSNEIFIAVPNST